MPAIVRELIIAAAPERVWDALTQPGEIGHWWTNDLNITPEVGSLAEFRFGEWGDFVIRFEIAELEQNEKVRWITRQGPSTGHWKGTSVTWRLTPVHGGAQVVFTHSGFAQADRCYEITHAWWEHSRVSSPSRQGAFRRNGPDNEPGLREQGDFEIPL